MKKKIVFVSLFWVVVLVAIWILNATSPVVSTDIALNAVNGKDTAGTIARLYSSAPNLTWLILIVSVLVSLFAFYGDIKNLLKKGTK